MNRKAIVFDMGGVLVDLDIEGCKAAFKNILGYDKIDEIIDPCHQKGIIGDLEEGMLEADEFRRLVLADSAEGCRPEDVDRAFWHILGGIEPYKGELLNRLAEKYDLYMLSNNNAVTIVRAYQMFEEVGAPVHEVFKKCFLSYEMKVLKPSESFYKRVLEEIGLPAEQVLFIDDSMANVEGAIAAGLPAVHYVPGSDLASLIENELEEPKLKFMSLSSGSCGNCYYLGNGNDGLLIDAGVSLRRLKKVLQENGLDMDSFSAILVTHDHLDHIRHLGSFCKKLCKPVYTTADIHRALARHTFTAPTIGPCRRILENSVWNDVAGFKVRYFIVPHDATQTVGYAIETGGRRFVIMTDIGRMTDEAVELSLQADTVVVESNYDMDMLMGGPYTYELKMRIVQGCGHLSNDECASAIKRFVHPGLRNIFLCHLSENNNTADLAYRSASEALAERGVGKGEIALRCLPRQYPSPMFVL